jgi:hypothetical protein
MDSMRSLNTSLPTSSSYPSCTEPPEQLLQAFKTAALSVTNLYKTAVSDQVQARHIGYQEALEDIRAFLDKERLGLDDGEGLKVRNWVMERIDGTGAATSESDDDRGDIDKGTRSLSPTTARKEGTDMIQPCQQSRSRSPPRPEAAGPPQSSTAIESNNTRPTTFTFTAGPQFPSPQPQDVDMLASDVGSMAAIPLHIDPHPSVTPTIPSPSVRLEVVPRGSRTPHRHSNTARHGTRTSTRDSVANSGTKRKFHFGDFFDISGFGNGKDAFGSGKRGRFM